MSDQPTPLTDSQPMTGDKTELVDADFARRLEREHREFVLKVNKLLGDMANGLSDDLESGSHVLNNLAWNDFNSHHKYLNHAWNELAELVHKEIEEQNYDY